MEGIGSWQVPGEHSNIIEERELGDLFGDPKAVTVAGTVPCEMSGAGIARMDCGLRNAWFPRGRKRDVRLKSTIHYVKIGRITDALEALDRLSRQFECVQLMTSPGELLLMSMLQKKNALNVLAENPCRNHFFIEYEKKIWSLILTRVREEFTLSRNKLVNGVSLQEGDHFFFHCHA